MAESQEKLEILNMIRDGKVTPEQGVRLIEALDSSTKKGGSDIGDGPKWLNIEVRAKSAGRYKTITPVRIPFSLIRLFFRFIPKDSSIPGADTTLEEALKKLETGKPIELYLEEGDEGRSIRITAD